MPMTESEAQELASKRNKHVSKHQSNMVWDAVHNSVKGWHVAFVPKMHALRTRKVATPSGESSDGPSPQT